MSYVGPAASPGAADPSKGGAVSNKAGVVAAMKQGFKRCYDREVTLYPTHQGTVRLTIGVAADGTVSEVTSTTTGSLSSAVADCLEKHAAKSVFSPPDSGWAVVEVPVTFVRH